MIILLRLKLVPFTAFLLAGNFVDYLEPVKNAFREKRFVVRELSYDSAKAGGIDAAIATAKDELKQARTTAVRWCKAHFGEVYSAWLHLKVIQAFVESVLRYGLPVDFVSFFVQPDMKYDKEVRIGLLRTILSVRPELKPKKILEDDEDEEADVDTLPFVCIKTAIIGSVAT